MSDISNADFDVNILEDALTHPNLELTFPLPTDKETYIGLDANEKVANLFLILGSFLHTFSTINFDEIYSNNEYRYSVTKQSSKFNKALSDHMIDRLQNTDEKLDEAVYKLIDQELRLNLIKAKDFPQRFKEVKAFMVNYYTKENEKNMPQYGSRNYLRVCYITVMATLRKMFPNGIWCNRTQLSNLYKRYLEDPMSIVFLPNHQSHLDYIIMHVVTIRFQMSIPAVIAGENLNVAIFGKFLKNLGAIYIKRSFNNEVYTERNLSNMIEFLLLNKVHVEVFIEGTRSRDGKALVPKYGILKTLANIYLKQRNVDKNASFDMLIQPVSITYERIYEVDGYLDELIGNDKKQESMTVILRNGLGNLLYGVDKDDDAKLPTGAYDNSKKSLHGKIFIKLGESFSLSSFARDPSNLIDADTDENTDSTLDSPINLKKLAFKVFHEINRVSFIPEVAIIGGSIQTFHYYTGKKVFSIEELLPIMNVLIEAFLKEESSETNLRILTDMKSLPLESIILLVKRLVVKFFRYVKISDFKRNTITINNALELLYYKNLTIHLIIHKCLASFILLHTQDISQVYKLHYIFTGFLKHEFLFDYNYNPKNELRNVLKAMKADGIIDNKYNVVDRTHLEIFLAIIKPFIESYMICISNINYTIGSFFKNISRSITETQLINDLLMSKDYPTTKMLLRIIQTKEKDKPIESTNKQYLLSCLFYLNNLKLIKIFKNKSKTKAFVIIENQKDLHFILDFLTRLVGTKEGGVDDVRVNYMIDIIDKNQDRDIGEYRAKF